MNFSSPIKYSGFASFSPNGKYFAITKTLELLIYEAENLTFLQKFTFVDTISHIEWAPDSSLVLVGLFKRGQCEVKSIDNPDWNCHIDEGLAGMSYARWAPDSRRIMTVCDFNIKMTIWSLVDKSTNYLQYPKYSDKGISFTSNGFFMALGERRETKDYIGVYYVGDWTLVSHFAIETYDFQDLMWSKDNTAIIAWDSVLECKFLIYSPTGNLIASHQPYELSLGIKSLNISPNGHYLAVGFYDQNVRLYNHVSWKNIIDFQHTEKITDTANINIFIEEEIDDQSFTGEDKKSYKYSIHEGPYSIKNIIKPQLDKPNQQIGIGEMSWSYDSNFLATKNDNMPNTIWIWEVTSLSLYAVAVQKKPVKAFVWSPSKHILAIATENSKIYILTLEGASVCDIPLESKLNVGINKIHWNVDGKSFIISEKNYVFVGHPYLEENEENKDYEERGMGHSGNENEEELENVMEASNQREGDNDYDENNNQSS